MSDPWKIYDELIDAIPADVTVASGAAGLRWCRIVSSEGGMGIAYTIPERSREPEFVAPTLVGVPLRDIAALSKSWNFAEAGLGMAAVNAWYATPDRSQGNGFVPADENSWRQAFGPYAQAVAGKVVSVIGHFPFAPKVLERAADLRIIERSTHPGDFPDPACEYLLPDSDFVFISSSAFVNKTMPRLLELARDATTIVLGPSTPLGANLFDHGVDVAVGFVSHTSDKQFDSLGGLTLEGMHNYGYVVEQRHDPA